MHESAETSFSCTLRGRDRHSHRELLRPRMRCFGEAHGECTRKPQGVMRPHVTRGGTGHAWARTHRSEHAHAQHAHGGERTNNGLFTGGERAQSVSMLAHLGPRGERRDDVMMMLFSRKSVIARLNICNQRL